jgi:hypothetical protein
MNQAAALTATDKVNYLNIAFMLASCTIALFLPFELFLFAYAILGPAHYLTEISWLQKRQFFTRGKNDFWLLCALAVLVCFTAPWSNSSAMYTFLAFGCALVLVLTAGGAGRIVGLVLVGLLALALLNSTAFPSAIFLLFVPTLVHVYLFTGFFMLYGALKDRRASGYVAFLIFLLCPLACWLIDPGQLRPAGYAMASYWNNFSTLNLALLGIKTPQTPADAMTALKLVFTSRTGLIVMRFIAFAYTYHYLNWFSKARVIRWHEMGGKRLIVIAALWAAAVGLYFYNFVIGFKVLFYLSIAHVYLEFPLNHVSIMGTYRELRGRLGGKPMQPALAAAAAKGRR